ncbi:MAG: hypothetical protein JNM94_16315 [Phycisphaerae bacterium]|nr:hypothetical protein [Phycisphaerae bacterium]
MAHASHSQTDVTTDVQIDDPEGGSTWFVTLAGSVVFAALVLAISVIYFAASNRETDLRVIDERVVPLEQMRAEQKQLLADYARIEVPGPDGKPVERIRIPINGAMRAIAVELSTVKPATPAGGAAK